ncbi:Ppx/GppA family phosphatase [Oceanicaulis sp. LC35]|uniref:Ppx/GppA phosphatase family protein n=1 Tax=Oceanicaulis sp. LC35 TaxID=3349635 RepID=UPI003F82DFC0
MGVRDIFGFGSAEPRLKGRDVAVIDVGSNSVRLVQFRVKGRVLLPVFNEKTMAGLGKGAAETGRLNPEGVEAALRTLKRFTRLLDAKGVTTRGAVATAAVRECEDGPDFVERVRQETGLVIDVLSGEEEGRYSALGVLAGVGDAWGVAGDLGGSSLELTGLDRRSTQGALTLPLGPLAVNAAGTKAEDLRDHVDSQLERASDVLKQTGETFYAVGGAWRSFANLSMSMRNYPLRLLHEYEMSLDQVRKTAQFAMSQSESSLASVPGVSSKRAATLPYAALLLERIMKAGGFKRVVFSAYGLREGVVCVSDPSLVEEGDPLISGAEIMALSASPEPGFGPALADWLEPAFTGDIPVFGEAQDKRLRAAAARLSDIGARLHPDHRGDLAFTQVLYAPIGGLSHAERAFLALTLHHRYEGKASRGEDCVSTHLLDDAQRTAALKLGLGMRFGAALSGRTGQLLSSFVLTRTEDALVITPAADASDLIVERALRRFEQFCAAMELKAAPEV